MFWRDATDVGGIKSGSTERARREKINLLSKRVRGRIFQSGMSCLVRPPSFPLLLRLYTIVWYLSRPQKSTAPVAQVPKESLSLLKSFISFLPLFLYFCLTFSISLQFSQVLLLQSVSK